MNTYFWNPHLMSDAHVFVTDDANERRRLLKRGFVKVSREVAIGKLGGPTSFKDALLTCKSGMIWRDYPFTRCAGHDHSRTPIAVDS